MIQVITAQYGEIPVLFQTNAFINATAIAKQFNKQPRDYLKSEQTKSYIESIKRILLIEQNQLVVVKKGSSDNGGGTWFHPKLAIDFARWLNSDFAVWCDMQIEKILHSRQAEPAQAQHSPEPIKITYATPEQREPLNKAVCELVYRADSKGRKLSHAEIYRVVHMTMGVQTTYELTAEQIPEAIKVVGSMLREIVLEGEYIAKGEQSKEKAAPAEKIVYITNKQKQELHEACKWVTMACHDEPSASGWLMNGMRAAFSISTQDDLPASQFDAAMAFIKSKEQDCSLLFGIIDEIRTDFYKNVLSNGAPHLGDIKRKYYAKYQEKLTGGVVNWVDIINQLQTT